MSDSTSLFPVEDDDSFGLTQRDLLRTWFKYWPTVIICMVIVSALLWSVLLVQPSIYETSAEVWVQTEEQGTPSFLSGIAAVRESLIPEASARKIETEIQLLLSRANVEAVINELGITKSQLVQSPLDYVKDAAPPWLVFWKPKSAAQVRIETVELFLGNISVEPTRSKTADTTSDVLEARFATADKTLAPRALAALLRQYIEFGAQHNRKLGESTYRLVDAKINEENEELKSLDDQILALTVEAASRADVTTPGTAQSPDRVVHTPSGSVTLDSPLANGRTNSSSGLGLLKTETIDLQARLEEARQLYTDDSPNVRHLTEQLASMRARLNAGVHANAELDTKLERLDRLRALALERFTELRTKRDQIELYLKLNPVEADARLIIEAPFQPEKPKIKNKILLGVMGPVVGLLLGLLLIGLREYFDHRLQDPEDVKRHLGLDTLAILPKAGT
jgi:uncharacterized protein involved in exopolysaccharide biosynthesis